MHTCAGSSLDPAPLYFQTKIPYPCEGDLSRVRELEKFTGPSQVREAEAFIDCIREVCVRNCWLEPGITSDTHRPLFPGQDGTVLCYVQAVIFNIIRIFKSIEGFGASMRDVVPRGGRRQRRGSEGKLLRCEADGGGPIIRARH